MSRFKLQASTFRLAPALTPTSFAPRSASHTFTVERPQEMLNSPYSDSHLLWCLAQSKLHLRQYAFMLSPSNSSLRARCALQFQPAALAFRIPVKMQLTAHAAGDGAIVGNKLNNLRGLGNGMWPTKIFSATQCRKKDGTWLCLPRI